MAAKVFVSVTMSLDGFIAPEAVPVEDVFSPEGRNDPRVRQPTQLVTHLTYAVRER
jgi:hypothetical protein